MNKIIFDSKFISEELKKSEQGFSNIFKKYYSGSIHVSSVVKRKGYVWNDEIKLYEYLCPEIIMNEISNILRDSIEYCIKKIYDVDDDILSQEEKKKKCKPLESFKILACKSQTIKNVYNFLLSKYKNNDIDKLMDNCENVIPLKGGKLLNLQTGEIRLRNNTDYFTYEKNFEYLGTDQKKTEMIDDFFDKICCENKEKKQYLKMVMGQSITNYIKNKCFYIFYGKKGNNGKSTLMALMKEIFNDLYCAVPDNLLYAENKDKISDTEFGSLVGKTIGTSIEPKDKYTNDEILKLLTGGDSISCRRLYSDQFTYTPKIKIFILLNNIIKIGNIGNDEIMIKRTRVINFDAEFVADPDPLKPYQYKADLDLEQKFKTSYKNEFFTYIVNCAIEFLKSDKTAKIPQIIEEERRQYFDSMDYINQALSETFEFTKNSKDKVLSSEVLEVYNQVCIEQHKKYNEKVLCDYLERKLGAPKKTSGTTRDGEKANGYFYYTGIKYKTKSPFDGEEEEEKDDNNDELLQLRELVKKQAEEIEKLKKLLEAKNEVKQPKTPIDHLNDEFTTFTKLNNTAESIGLLMDLEDEINQENNKISFRGFGRKQTKIEEPKPITKKISRVIDENDIENLFLETVINSTIKKKTVNRVGK